MNYLQSHQLFLLSIFSLTIAATSQYPQKMVINIPVANLREIPQANSVDLKLPTNDLTNSLQVTQLLLGEHVIAYEEHIDAQQKVWLKIGAVQQEYFTHV